MNGDGIEDKVNIHKNYERLFFPRIRQPKVNLNSHERPSGGSEMGCTLPLLTFIFLHLKYRRGGGFYIN